MKPTVNPDEEFDSIYHAVWHKSHVETIMNLLIIAKLAERAKHHDDSKLSEPEKSGYDKFIPLLASAKYNTPEYNKIRDDMKTECLDHHYEENRHHPEHFRKGIMEMNILDVVEMMCDWFAASLNSDTTFIDGLGGNLVRFKIPPMLGAIIENTYYDIFRPYEKLAKTTDFTELSLVMNDLKLSAYEAASNEYITNKMREEIISQLNIIRDENLSGN